MDVMLLWGLCFGQGFDGLWAHGGQRRQRPLVIQVLVQVPAGTHGSISTNTDNTSLIRRQHDCATVALLFAGFLPVVCGLHHKAALGCVS